jgi:hypothetical protein
MKGTKAKMKKILYKADQKFVLRSGYDHNANTHRINDAKADFESQSKNNIYGKLYRDGVYAFLS